MDDGELSHAVHDEITLSIHARERAVHNEDTELVDEEHASHDR